ncbi:MAG: hypothetical protein CO182_09135, partial [Lysobacterales bacterium CG_4_9_14_3_um_filter_62_6]
MRYLHMITFKMSYVDDRALAAAGTAFDCVPLLRQARSKPDYDRTPRFWVAPPAWLGEILCRARGV